MVIAQDRLNGTSVPMEVLTQVIDFSEIGQPGWHATVRTNPRSSVYDDLVSLEEGRWWRALGKVVFNWNFAAEDGTPLPQPSEAESEHELDLPYGVLTYLFAQIIEAVKMAAAFPKAPSAGSAITGTTSAEDQRRE